MKTHLLNIILWITLLSIFSCSTKMTINKKQPEKNPNNSKAIVFVDSLLQKMTLDEKIGQTILFSSGSDITGPTIDKNFVDYLKDGMLGAVFSVPTVKATIDLQKIAVEETRLGIPLLFGYDVIHGYKTIFPISLGESASWDLDLIEKSSRIAAEEASASGFHWTFAPMIDITRDPRWGRVSEGAGEDVFLGSAIAKARVKGFQGDDLSKNNTILACAKHFAAYGAAIAGRDYNTVDMSERELRTTYLPPFKAAIDAGVTTFMTSFNDLNGVPASGNKFLLSDILRNEWNFDGFVVTDYTSINEMIPHGYSKDEKQAGEQALNAGVDMDMQGGVFLRNLKKLVEEGKVSEEKITAAARRILILKYRLGLFEDPYRYSNEQREKVTLYKPEYLETAKELAQKSIVLLKNKNNILPLNKHQKIALIGPLVKDESHILGTWIARGDRTGKAVSVYEGIENLLGNTEIIEYAKGCEIEGNDKSKFNEAVNIAKESDVVVMVLGESHGLSGEAASRTNLDLPGVQKELIAEIKRTGKPIILILMNGRPLTLEYENEVTDAILETWFSGTLGGTAITDVLFGVYNPSGKLTMSFPRNVGQIPIYYNHKNTGRPYEIKGAEQLFRSKYLDVPNSPLYPFGYGLSYTSFEYSDLKINKKEFNFNETIEIRVTVTNTGKYDGEEIVQLYIQDIVGSVTRPVKELKGFEKVFLKIGESKEISFSLTSKNLAFYTIDMSFKAEVGDFKIFVGTNSAKLLESAFVLK
ncbi:glycoside hydrolase family 3 N-terminal domain-containing protein [Lutibacter sp.]|uniref:glycoside hydrolase family 3 N-terminal domain-containing protein n=1 Tax=Lutibacter sp. TaxID=1925666 RepID=UPI001A26A931|nr:glycoside hydrolase family 3 N-terminal domain-containing protein [Lutibacter sp.]MBI9042092.1 glycoside hydrolase family 3 C-terminal domain-containing protein [Lutibacter sp.]